MIKMKKRKKFPPKRKFLFLRILQEDKEGVGLIRKSTKPQSQRRLKSYSPMLKKSRIAIGLQKQKKMCLREAKEVEETEEIGMITKPQGEEIKKMEESIEEEGIGKVKKVEDIRIGAIEIIKVEAAIIGVEIVEIAEIAGRDSVVIAEIAEKGLEEIVERDSVEIVEIEMVDKIIGGEIMMNKARGEEIIAEEATATEAEAGETFETITMIEIQKDHLKKLSR
jgi:hypothetical protein